MLLVEGPQHLAELLLGHGVPVCIAGKLIESGSRFVDAVRSAFDQIARAVCVDVAKPRGKVHCPLEVQADVAFVGVAHRAIKLDRHPAHGKGCVRATGLGAACQRSKASALLGLVQDLLKAG